MAKEMSYEWDGGLWGLQEWYPGRPRRSNRQSGEEGSKMSPQFQPKTSRIDKLARAFPYVVEDLRLLDRKTSIYIDYAMFAPWSERLGWHVD